MTTTPHRRLSMATFYLVVALFVGLFGLVILIGAGGTSHLVGWIRWAPVACFTVVTGCVLVWLAKRHRAGQPVPVDELDDTDADRYDTRTYAGTTESAAA